MPDASAPKRMMFFVIASLVFQNTGNQFKQGGTNA